MQKKNLLFPILIAMAVFAVLGLRVPSSDLGEKGAASLDAIILPADKEIKLNNANNSGLETTASFNARTPGNAGRLAVYYGDAGEEDDLLFVSDKLHGTVSVFTLTNLNLIKTISGLRLPYSLAIDESDRSLYVTERLNFSIRKYSIEDIQKTKTSPIAVLQAHSDWKSREPLEVAIAENESQSRVLVTFVGSSAGYLRVFNSSLSEMLDERPLKNTQTDRIINDASENRVIILDKKNKKPFITNLKQTAPKNTLLGSLTSPSYSGVSDQAYFLRCGTEKILIRPDTKEPSASVINFFDSENFELLSAVNINKRKTIKDIALTGSGDDQVKPDKLTLLYEDGNLESLSLKSVISKSEIASCLLAYKPEEVLKATSVSNTESGKSTSAETTQGLNIGNLTVNTINNCSVQITWETNLKAASEIRFGTSSELNMVIQNLEVLTQPSFFIRDLVPNTRYYFKVRSFIKDEESKESESELGTFLTSSGNEEKASVSPSGPSPNFAASQTKILAINQVYEDGIANGEYSVVVYQDRKEPQNSLLFSSHSQGGVVKIWGLNTGKVIGIIPGLTTPRGLALDEEGEAFFVADSGSDAVYKYLMSDILNFKFTPHAVFLSPASWRSREPIGLAAVTHKDKTEIFVTYSGAADKFIRVFDENLLNMIREWKVQTPTLASIAAIGDRGLVVVTDGGSNSIKAFEMNGTPHYPHDIGEAVFVDDPKGLSVLRCDSQKSYIIASDGSHKPDALFLLFDAETFEFVKSFSVPGIAGVSDFALALGELSGFSKGALFAVSEERFVAGVPFADIAKFLDLGECT